MGQGKMHCNKTNFYWFKMKQHLFVAICLLDEMTLLALSITVYVSVRNHDNLIIR